MSEETKPAYGLVQINIKNQDEFMDRYAQHVFPILDAWGIETVSYTHLTLPTIYSV